jgi:O-antigen/teichoic acid export membrane protein
MLTFNKINSLQIFQVLQFGTAILIGILLVKAGLPTSLVSVYEALMFLASLSCFFWVVGGQNALLQLYSKLDATMQRRAIFNVFLLFSIASIATGSLFFLFQQPISQQLTSFEQLPLLNLLALFLAINSPTFLLHIFYLLLGKYRQIVVFGAVSFSLQLVLVVLPIFLNLSLRESMYGLVLWALVKYIWTLVAVLRNAELRLDFVFLKTYLPLVLPLLLFAAISKGSEYISGLAVSHLFSDKNAFAIFRYGARELPLAVLMVGALATALTPEMTENQALGLKNIKSKTAQLSKWLYPISILSMLAAPFLFPLFFNEDFKASARIFNIFNLLLASRILLPQVVTMAAGRNYVLTIVALVELVVLAILSFWWGSLFGLEGVAWAAVVAFMVDRVALMWYNWWALGIAPANYVDWRAWFGYNLALIAAFVLSTFL